jgi:stalled ribosome rescue protein Dom34
MSTFHAIVWLDRNEAHVILFDREHIAAQKIKSRSTHKAGGAPGRGDLPKTPHSPKNGDEEYYHAIAESLKGVHEILVTGPAQAKDEFKAHCARHDKDIDKAIVDVISSDHPSDGQLVAMARQYFLKYDRMQGQA